MAVDKRMSATTVAEALLEDYQHAYDTWRELYEMPTHPSDLEETILCLRCHEAWGVYEKMRDRITHLLTVAVEAERKD